MSAYTYEALIDELLDATGGEHPDTDARNAFVHYLLGALLHTATDEQVESALDTAILCMTEARKRAAR